MDVVFLSHFEMLQFLSRIVTPLIIRQFRGEAKFIFKIFFPPSVKKAVGVSPPRGGVPPIRPCLQSLRAH